jgi:hypothetical protein
MHINAREKPIRRAQACRIANSHAERCTDIRQYYALLSADSDVGRPTGGL